MASPVESKQRPFLAAKEDEVVTTSTKLLKRFSIKHSHSCINTIRHDFPNVLLDLSGLNFEAKYGANIVPSDVSDPTDLPLDEDISEDEEVMFEEKDNIE